MTQIQAVAFDLDGTLVDTSDAHGEAYRLAFADYGIQVSGSAFSSHAGKHHTEIIRLLAGDLAGSIDAAAIHERKTEYYEQVAADLGKPLPLLFLLSVLSISTPIALVTSATRQTAEATLSTHGGLGRFHVVVAADDVRRHKPDPEPYFLAAELLSVTPSELLVFEDSTPGMAAARKAGCPVIQLLHIPDTQTE